MDLRLCPECGASMLQQVRATNNASIATVGGLVREDNESFRGKNCH